ncbi:MAG: EamA family transporter RarD [Pseudomonadota bacterium]|nr:EamA family transporter RarD [Pseudomonadota bacterium]
MTTPAQGRTAAEDALRLGLICGVGAYAIWGFLPVYLKQLSFASPWEVVAHRIVWSVPFGALLLTTRKQWPEVRAALAAPRVLALLGLASLFIAANWTLYVWAVANGQVLAASLGYYINPLMFIAAGVVVLREKLNRLQIAAIALAAAGVLTLTIGAGVFPVVSVALAFLFTGYGYVRKTTPVGAMPGLFLETCLLSPFAAFYLFWLWRQGGLAFGAHGAGADALLIFAGPVTVVPLVLFAMAARRLKMTTVGFLQYIAPTGQLLLGLYYGETFTLYHAVCFGLIWTALLMISIDAVRRNRAEKLARCGAGVLPVGRTDETAASRAASESPKSS